MFKDLTSTAPVGASPERQAVHWILGAALYLFCWAMMAATIIATASGLAALVFVIVS